MFYILQINADSGDVQMSGACLPRRAALPTNLKDAVASDFVYLPKNVLLGDEYDASSDIFCFALTYFELKLNPRQRVFQTERMCTIEQFHSLDTTAILEAKLLDCIYQKDFRQLIRKCLDSNPTGRPSAIELWREHNRQMEKSSRRFGMVNGAVTHRNIWSSYRAQHKLK